MREDSYINKFAAARKESSENIIPPFFLFSPPPSYERTTEISPPSPAYELLFRFQSGGGEFLSLKLAAPLHKES